jgi:nucleoside-diphosphate-sugar epimerase
MEIRGKRVLITGASRGIGESLAHAFARAGATVALVARTKDAIAALADELGGTAHPADLSDPTQVADLVGHVEEEAGPIDVLVNNAGVGIPAAFTDAPDDDLRIVTQVNYLAPAELCRQVIPRMLGRGGGHVVNVSSMAGCSALPGLVRLLGIQGGAEPFHGGTEGGPARVADRYHARGARADPYRDARPHRRLRADGRTCGCPSEWPCSQSWLKRLGASPK